MAAEWRERRVCSSTDDRSGSTKGNEQMHPVIQYEIAKMRVQELHQEAERERLIRLAARDRQRGVEWTSFGSRLRARLFGSVQPQPKGAEATA